MDVVGSPKPAVKWLVANEPVVEDQRIQTEHKDDTYALLIDGAQLGDENEYKCMANNEHGLSECSCELLVDEAPQKPEFLKELKDMTVDEGSDATFEVQVSGQPEPEVQWFKDDVLQEPGDRIETMKEGDIHTFG